MLGQTYRFNVGKFQCIAISDSDTPIKEAAADFLAKSVPPDALQTALRHHNIQDGALRFSVNLLYIDTGEHRVLVDTGIGRGVAGLGVGRLWELLQAEGIVPADISRVILTHAHWDHIGGNAGKDGQPAFPKARFTIWKSEWEHWTSEGNLAKMDETNASFARENLPPIRACLDLLKTETDIVPGICAVHAPGHTLGQIGLLIRSGGEGLLHLADVAHHPIEFEHPDWSPWFEADIELSAATRRKLLARAADEKLLVMTSHFAFPGIGRVTRDGASFRWQPVGEV